MNAGETTKKLDISLVVIKISRWASSFRGRHYHPWFLATISSGKLFYCVLWPISIECLHFNTAGEKLDIQKYVLQSSIHVKVPVEPVGLVYRFKSINILLFYIWHVGFAESASFSLHCIATGQQVGWSNNTRNTFQLTNTLKVPKSTLQLQDIW